MSVFELEQASEELLELIERAKNGEGILIKDGDCVVRLEPINRDDGSLKGEN